MYVKLFTSIFQGTLRGNTHGLLVFTNLLAHCDRDGFADIHPRAIAEEIGLSQDQVRAALDELEAPDPESRSPDEEGRRIVRVGQHRSWGWRIVNYGKYRDIKNDEDRREANRLAVAKHRANKAASSPVIVGNARSSLSAQGEGYGEAEVIQPPTPAGSPPGASESTEQKVKKPRAAQRPAIDRPAGVSEQTWGDWLSLRKAKRAPVTQTVVDGAHTEADKAQMSLEDFLRAWCRRGSQGLEASWLKPEERRGSDDRISRQLETAALMTGSRNRKQLVEAIDVDSREIPPGLLG